MSLVSPVIVHPQLILQLLLMMTVVGGNTNTYLFQRRLSGYDSVGEKIIQGRSGGKGAGGECHV